ncbi:MAG: Stk1 family PASTA domain-containing Ser/Thr kinase [Clostridia bacterium]|nr:Stk1 family PASTA domain-containing Ser/Thr kinase [Clostridia bacterium]
MIGKILSGRYEIIEKVGEGGMAVVFKARCRLLKRYVAVKILKPEFTKDEKFIASFRRESQAAASLSHANIVNVYDVGVEAKKIHFIVMELVEGQVLSDLIKNSNPMPIDKVIYIAKQITSALIHAHKNHIIHRDIKPHNILITKEGRAKVTDFGIARAVTQTTIVSNKEDVMGSVHYFSPEQARGGYVDEKSDIYSMGIVLYEMVTGKVPFEAESPVSVAMKHISEPMVLPSKINAKVPKYLENIILKATEKIQVKRYSNALEMYNDLEKASSNMYMNPSLNYNDHDDKNATRVVPVINDSGEKSDSIMKKKKTTKKKQKKNLKNTILHRNTFIKLGAITLAIFFAFFISNTIMFLKGLFFVKEIPVPDIMHIDSTQAVSNLEELGLQFEKEMQYSNVLQEGQVISQDPEPGTVVKEGAVVRVTVSKGEKLIAMPSLINKKLNDALFLLDKNNLAEGIVVKETSELPVGVVIRQDPDPDEEVPENTEVNLVVSDGVKIKTILMINVMGKGIEDAKSDIEEAGLKIGQVEYIDSEEYEKDQVVSQSIDAGKEIKENTAISLQVSKGSNGTEPSEPVDGDTDALIEVPLKLYYDQAESDIFTIKIFKIQDGNIEMVYNNVHNKENSGEEEIVISGYGKARIAIYYDEVLIAEKNLDFEKGQFYD